MTRDKQMGGIVGVLTIRTIDKQTGNIVDEYSDRNVVTVSGMGYMWQRLSKKSGSLPFKFDHFTFGSDTGAASGGPWDEFLPKPAENTYTKSNQTVIYEDDPANLVDTYPEPNTLQLSSLLDGQFILDNYFPSETEVIYNSATLRFANDEVFSYKRFPVRTISRLLDVQVIWEFTLVDSALFDCGILIPDSEPDPDDHNFDVDIYAGYWGDNTIHKINDQGQTVWVYGGHTDWVTDLAVDDNFLYSVSRDREVHIIDKAAGTNIASVAAHSDVINSIIVDGGNIITASDDKDVKKWDASGGLLWTYAGSGKAMDVINTPSGAYIAVYRTGQVVVLDSSSGVPIDTISMGEEIVATHMDVEGSLYISTHDGTDFFVRKIDTTTYTPVWSIIFDEYVFNIRSDDNANIFTVDDKDELRMFDRAGSPLWINEKHIDIIRGLDRDEYGYLYTGSLDQTVRKFTPVGDHVWTYNRNENPASCIVADKA